MASHIYEEEQKQRKIADSIFDSVYQKFFDESVKMKTILKIIKNAGIIKEGGDYLMGKLLMKVTDDFLRTKKCDFRTFCRVLKMFKEDVIYAKIEYEHFADGLGSTTSDVMALVKEYAVNIAMNKIMQKDSSFKELFEVTKEDYVFKTIKKATFTDPRDDKVYKTVKIGDQIWMAENLAYAAKGSKIYGEGGPVYSYYDKKNEKDILTTLSKTEIQANEEKYGRLYDWETAKKACPPGWHLPSKDEWKILINFTGGKISGKKLKTTSGWDKYGKKDGNGTDDFGFAGLPNGIYANGDFRYLGRYGVWWSASALEEKANLVYDWNLGSTFQESRIDTTGRNSNYLLSVRCIKD
ncbi:MAG: hypothetical protein LBC75_00720 [Fibromonadaceae bacterium]|jgi:uncharacterized protein (TIGR02145 family)|nr:hypothetical protein [Fibromonadaceae bacterium]